MFEGFRGGLVADVGGFHQNTPQTDTNAAEADRQQAVQPHGPTCSLVEVRWQHHPLYSLAETRPQRPREWRQRASSARIATAAKGSRSRAFESSGQTTPPISALRANGEPFQLNF